MIDQMTIIDTTSADMKLKPEKNSGLNGIRTRDLCDTGAVFCQLSYQAKWELVTLKVRNILVDGEDTSEYMKNKCNLFQAMNITFSFNKKLSAARVSFN